MNEFIQGPITNILPGLPSINNEGSLLPEIFILGTGFVNKRTLILIIPSYMIQRFIGWSLLFFILCFSGKGFAQDKNPDTPKQYYLSGKVLNLADSSAIPGAHILRFSNSNGVVSNDNGQFRLKLTKNDSAMISVVGYKRYVVNLPDSLDKKIYHARIYMVPKTYNLPTVIIEEEGNKGSMDLELPELDGQQIKAEQRYEDGNAGYVIEGPISSIYNAFSEEKQEEKRLKELKLNRQNRKYIANSPYVIYIQEELGIGKDEIKRFLNYCNFDKDYKGANYYDIIAKLKNCYRLYYRENR